MNPILVLCLGNEILSDDAFGFHVAESLTVGRCPNRYIDILFAPIAGFHLLDMIAFRRAVLIVDTIITGNYKPGHLHYFQMAYDAPTKGLVTSHQISLPVALKFGSKLGLKMPRLIDVLAVEASYVYTLSETMTQPIKESITHAFHFIDNWIKEIDCNKSFQEERLLSNVDLKK